MLKDAAYARDQSKDDTDHFQKAYCLISGFYNQVP